MLFSISTAGLDIGPLTGSSPVVPSSQIGRRTPRSLPEEPLDGILSPELDKMVTDGQCNYPDRHIHLIYCVILYPINKICFVFYLFFRVNSQQTPKNPRFVRPFVQICLWLLPIFFFLFYLLYFI